MPVLRSASCRAEAALIASGCCSQRRVLPSISVKRKVTVPVGSSGIVRAPQRIANSLRQRHRPALRPRGGERFFAQGSADGTQLTLIASTVGRWEGGVDGLPQGCRGTE